MDTPLVSVVIPAYNAARTIVETLQSVSAQTYRYLEIILVDDGSLDQTFELAQDFQRSDSRLKVIQKPNGGVASARNTGIQASSGEFVAFIDADDLWHPTKIAKQIRLLLDRGEETALVYSPFRQIDMQGIVHGSSRNHRVEGWVINRHFYVNIVGNGSSILVRKQVLEAIGGYSSILLQNDAQGCEDFLLQLRIALRYRFATVPEYLVGYRDSPGNMSKDEEKMLRSSILTLSLVLAECPDLAELAQRGLLARRIWQYMKVIFLQRRFKKGLCFIWPYLRGAKGGVAKAIRLDFASKCRNFFPRIRRMIDGRLNARIPRRHFYAYDPADMNYSDHLPMTLEKEAADEIYRNLRALAPLDAQYDPGKYLPG